MAKHKLSMKKLENSKADKAADKKEVKKASKKRK